MATDNLAQLVFHGAASETEWQRTPAGNATADTADAGVQTDYIYDAYGRLQKVDYPAAASATAALTADVMFTYDSAGSVLTRSDGGGTTTYTRKPWGSATKETIGVSGIPGVTNVTAEVERTLDAHNRLDLLKSKWGTLVSNDTDYGFDATTGLLQSVSFGGRTATFSYVHATQQVGGITYAHSGQTMLATTKNIDTHGRVNYIHHTAGGVYLQKFNYSYSFDRVTQVTSMQK